MSRRRSAGRRANLQACWPPPSEGPNARLDEKGGGAVRERSRAHGGAAPGAAPACAVRTERGSSPRRSPSVSGDREKGGRGGGGGGTGGRRRQTIPGTPGLKALAGAPPPPGAAAFCASLSGEPPRLKEGGGGRRLPINESQPRGEVSRPRTRKEEEEEEEEVRGTRRFCRAHWSQQALHSPAAALRHAVREPLSLPAGPLPAVGAASGARSSTSRVSSLILVVKAGVYPSPPSTAPSIRRHSMAASASIATATRARLLQAEEELELLERAVK
ncbi:unnamed protein product [Prorocentrum cordatum]|uniref:Uncharacterized protein n=1 Tax=Prorocentrum cordatum TaxID=2364126 RepID=A0ABN9U921_9DINO|nr:unnamed protein product [Polarella glacialis]